MEDTDTDEECFINWGNMSEVYDKISKSGQGYKNAHPFSILFR